MLSITVCLKRQRLGMRGEPELQVFYHKHKEKTNYRVRIFSARFRCSNVHQERQLIGMEYILFMVVTYISENCFSRPNIAFRGHLIYIKVSYGNESRDRF